MLLLIIPEAPRTCAGRATAELTMWLHRRPAVKAGLRLLCRLAPENAVARISAAAAVAVVLGGERVLW
jgi:hypothetical protein